VSCYASTPPTLGVWAFMAFIDDNNNIYLTKIYVPSGKASDDATTTIVDDYKAASGWNSYADIISAISE